MEQTYKKSAVDLTDLAIGIVTLAIVVSIGSYILVTYGKTQVTSLDTVSTINESITGLSHAGDMLANRWFISVTHCLNATTPYSAIPATNYTSTIDSLGQGTIYATGGQYNTTDLLCTYTRYNVSDPRFSLPENGSIGLAEYGNWFKIIVIVGVAAVVLSIIFLAFGGRSAGEDRGIGGSY